MNDKSRNRPVIRRVHILPSLLTVGNFACGFFSIILCLNALFFATRAKIYDEHTSTIEVDSATVMTSRVVGNPLTGPPRGALTLHSPRGNNARAAYMFHWACYIIFLGMLFDMLDGKVARLMGADSAFGKELDSLADVVTFGVAPPVIVNTLWIAVMPVPSAWWGQVLIFGAIFAICGMLRLARYNIQSDTANKNIFSGLPIPAAAGCVVTAVLLAQGGYTTVDTVCTWIAQFFGDGTTGIQVKTNLLALFLLVPGLLMVSTVPFTHLANRYLTGRKSFAILVTAILLLALVWIEPRVTLFLAFNGYMIAGLVSALRKWRAGETVSAADTEPDSDTEAFETET